MEMKQQKYIPAPAPGAAQATPGAATRQQQPILHAYCAWHNNTCA
ncbi:hypothetical protein A2U01_0051091 [Trifolium medium]|uniref:Uncharacterized protein n=1 Tax=Trifolium medium TaxID=97028 RepID=A0A392R1C0_9FABA|nr:hypothetical protein [Trifolium medium]